jgi:hypothetical protein
MSQKTALLMKTSLCIFLAIFLLTNCVGKTTTVPPSATSEPATETTQPVLEEENVKVTAEESAPLLIGGRQYRGQLGEMVEVEKGSWRIPGEPVYCTVDDIDKIFIVSLWIDPEDSERRNSLENLNLLYNLKELYIGGKNLDKVDFSPISSLYNLEKLVVDGHITRLPNLTELRNLRGITIKNGALESLEGIGAPNIRRIDIISWKGEIDSLAPLNNLLYLEDLEIRNIVSKSYRIADMSNLPSLKKLWLLMESTQIDLLGIENLTALEDLSVLWPNPFNIEGIGKLKNLEQLDLNLISQEPSLEFIRGMPNLRELVFYGDGNREGFPRETEAYQVLDMSPFASLGKLRLLYCTNFIIKNISALDANDLFSIDDPYNPSGIYLWRSRLYDDTEKSRHFLAIGELQSDK